jgi:hypothetical protein
MRGLTALVPRLRRIGVAVLVAIAAFFGVPGSASAHLGSSKYLDVAIHRGGATVTVAVDSIDAGVELGLGEEAAPRAVLRERARLARWLEEGISISRDGHRCRAAASEPVATIRDARAFVEVAIEYACGRGHELVLCDRTVFADDPRHEAFVRVHGGGSTSAEILRRGRQETVLTSPKTSGEVFTLYLAEGAIHFATGYDHVLFLLALLLAAGLVARERGARAAMKDVAFIVTAFTIGHSVTLAAAALEWVVLPSGPVEIAIALSIAAAATVNLVKPNARRGASATALGFGLVHGFGFSSVLGEQGLPTGLEVLALFAFNLGIELAQLGVVAIVLWPLARASKSDRYEPLVLRGGSIAIATIAFYWAIERTLG